MVTITVRQREPRTAVTCLIFYNSVRQYKYVPIEKSGVIVVATDDFEVYHDLVTELRERGLAFTTVEGNARLPDDASLVLTSSGESVDAGEVPVVRAESGSPRNAVEEAVALLRGEGGRTIVGIDPGEKPGIAVLVGEMIVATFQVPPKEVPAIVHEETTDAPDPLVRIGDGARLVGARLIDAIEEVPIELVDETGTTPYLGTGTRNIGDVLAAVNIARIEGEPVERRDIQPTEGELTRIKERSREESEQNRAIDSDLARRVAVGELTIQEALEEHDG